MDAQKLSLPLFQNDAPLPGEIAGHLRSIAKLVVQRKVQFLCGAGMSKASHCPLSSELAAKMVGEMLGADTSNDIKLLVGRYPFEAIAGAYLEIQDHLRLKKLIAEELDQGEGNLHAGHHALEYLASQGYIDKIYTTNFDLLLEEAFGERKCSVTDDDAYLVHEARMQNKIAVIHLHGTLNSHKYRIDERDTYHLDTALARVLMADMVTHWFIWVGYSLNDVDLRSIYLSMRDMLARTDDLVKKPYVVHPLTDELDGEAKAKQLEVRLATAVWKARGATFIPLRAEEFLPALVNHIRQIKGEEWAVLLAKQFGFDPRNEDDLKQVWGKADRLRKEFSLDDKVAGMKMLAQKHGIEVSQS